MSGSVTVAKPERRYLQAVDADGRLGQFKLAVGAGCGAQREGRIDSLQGNGVGRCWRSWTMLGKTVACVKRRYRGHEIVGMKDIPQASGKRIAAASSAVAELSRL